MDQREIMKYFEMNENKNTTYKNICDAMFRGNVYL